MVDQIGMQQEFLSPLLDDMTLKANYISRIADSLFGNTQVIAKCCETDIYSKLFSHPSFDPQVINLGQGYFLYGILSELGKVANRSGEDAARPYFKILDSYIHSYPEDDVPEATNFHIVGAAVHVASKSESKTVTDAAGLILRRYNKYINKPNPFGTLPINQVEKDSPIYRILINHGAISPEPEPGFWGSMMSVFNGKRKQAEVMQQESMENARVVAPNSNLMALRNQMRDDFRVMRNYINNDLCDTNIKLKCENMFLKSERLVMMMEKHNVNQSYEDMHFLGKNFSNYLKESLSSYISVCQATVDLASEDKKTSKLMAAKKQCMEQVDLLAEQVALISQNIFNEVEGNAARNLNVRGRVLQNLFPNAKDLGLEQIMDKNLDSINRISAQEANELPMPTQMRKTLEKAEEAEVEKEVEIGNTQAPDEDQASRKTAIKIRF
jgi:hypothetical protein